MICFECPTNCLLPPPTHTQVMAMQGRCTQMSSPHLQDPDGEQALCGTCGPMQVLYIPFSLTFFIFSRLYLEATAEFGKLKKGCSEFQLGVSSRLCLCLVHKLNRTPVCVR